MRSEAKRRVFRYMCENFPKELLAESTVDYLLDFKNGEAIYYLSDSYDDDPIAQLYIEYCEMEDLLDWYIEDNDLDDCCDYEQIVNHFSDWEEKGYFRYNQAILIEFEDFALSKAIDLANM